MHTHTLTHIHTYANQIDQADIIREAGVLLTDTEAKDAHGLFAHSTRGIDESDPTAMSGCEVPQTMHASAVPMLLHAHSEQVHDGLVRAGPVGAVDADVDGRAIVHRTHVEELARLRIAQMEQDQLLRTNQDGIINLQQEQKHTSQKLPAARGACKHVHAFSIEYGGGVWTVDVVS